MCVGEWWEMCECLLSKEKQGEEDAADVDDIDNMKRMGSARLCNGGRCTEEEALHQGVRVPREQREYMGDTRLVLKKDKIKP